MSLRESLNQNKALVVVVAVLLIVAAIVVGYVMRNGGSAGQGASNAYFLDTETDAQFTAANALSPPVTPPGKTAASGVRLHIFGCGSCKDKTKQFRGYLENSTPEANQARINMEKFENGELGPSAGGGGIAAFQQTITEGEQVAKPEKPYNWVLKASAEGQEVMVGPMAKCGTEKAVECFPR